MRRVAVTGMGVVSPLGNSAAEVFFRCRSGRSGIRALQTEFAHRLASPIACVATFDGAMHFDAPRLRILDRVSQMALFAAGQAIADARCHWAGTDLHRAGVFMGCGMGGISSNDEGFRTLYGQHNERVNPFTVLKGMLNAPAAWVALEHGIRGPSLTYSTACSSSAVAIGEAWLRIASGALDVALAGGTEAPLSLGSMKAWEALHTVARVDPAQATASCKPFSKNRSGMVLGEGAGVLVLEDWNAAVERGAAIHGEIVGYGVCTDPGHITQPSALGQAHAMQAALHSAGLDASEVDAINAHGTGTLANDLAETEAIKRVFGARASRIPIWTMCPTARECFIRPAPCSPTRSHLVAAMLFWHCVPRIADSVRRHTDHTAKFAKARVRTSPQSVPVRSSGCCWPQGLWAGPAWS